MLKKIIRVLLASVTVCLFMSGILSVQAMDNTINVIHTSDMQGTIFKNEETGTIGYGNILSVREKLTDTLVIDCGNFLGDVSQRETNLNEKVVYAMDKAGYNYATLGYNDLNYTKAEIDELFFGTKFEVLSSNIMIGDEYAFETTKTKMINGTKVGIFAITDCENTGEYIISDPRTEATNAIKKLKSGGSQVIICILNTLNTELSQIIAQENPEITLVLEGGTNNFMPYGTPVGKTLIVNPGIHGNAIGVSAVTVDSGKLKSFQTSNYDLLNIKAIFPETNTLEQEMQDAQGEIDTFNNIVLAIISEDLPYHEGEMTAKTTPLGNFVADVIKGITRADIAFIRGSQITGGLNKEITGKQINGLFKENDNIVVKQIPGSAIYKCIEISLNKLVADENGKTDYLNSGSDNFLQFSGLKVEYNLEYPSGSRIINLTTESGKRIGQFSNAKFMVAAPAKLMNTYSEYLSGATELKKKENIYQLTRDYLSMNKDIEIDLENRCTQTDAKKSYIGIILMITASVILAMLSAYGVAKIVMRYNMRY